MRGCPLHSQVTTCPWTGSKDMLTLARKSYQWWKSSQGLLYTEACLSTPLISRNLWQVRKPKDSVPRLADLKLDPFPEAQRCGRRERLGDCLGSLVLASKCCYLSPRTPAVLLEWLQTSSFPWTHTRSTTVYSALRRSRKTYFCLLLSLVWWNPDPIAGRPSLSSVLLPLKIYLFYMYVYLPLWVSVPHIHAGAQGSHKGHRFFGTAAIGSCEWPSGCWDLNQDLHKKKQMLLTTDPSLQSPPHVIFPLVCGSSLYSHHLFDIHP